MRRSRWDATSTVAAVILGCGLLFAAPSPHAVQDGVKFFDITPDNDGPMIGQTAIGVPDCPDPCASGRNGGRVNGLVGVPGDANTYFAASEVGGLFKSGNGGASWEHLDGHVPATTWDVAAAPGGQRVYATSFYDGRRVPLTGLEMSTDGGATWNRPPVAAPTTCSTQRAGQPSGFGIGLRPGTAEVFVGTNCGLARSADAGDHWVQFDPTPDDHLTASVWDVVALPGGRTYACGDDGLLISSDGQAGNWKSLPKPPLFPGGFCSLAVSPEDLSVVFVAFASARSFGDLLGAGCCNFPPSGGGAEFYEAHVDISAPSVTWSRFTTYPDDVGNSNPKFVVKKGRLPFVVTNKRSEGFDVWIGDGSLYRVPCSALQTPNCPTDPENWSGSFTDHPGGVVQLAHGDSGDLEFDPTRSVDACPTLYSSDGGIHSNAKTTSPNCQVPDFRGANVGMHAFLLWDMAGIHLPGESQEGIYIGTQDNGLYYTGNAGVADPAATKVTWTHGVGGDLYDLEADSTRVVVSGGGRDVIVADPGFQNGKSLANCLANRDIDLPELIAEGEPGHFLYALNNGAKDPSCPTIPVGVRETFDIANDPLGSPLGIWPSTAQPPCHIRVGVGPAGAQPYVLAGTCLWPRTDFTADQLWTYKGSAWTRIATPPKEPGDSIATGAGFGLIAVDATNPDRLYASVVNDNGPPRMMRSSDGGASWIYDEGLTDLMGGNGAFVSYPAVEGDGIYAFLQPMMVSFDPYDPRLLVAGGAASGVFLSSDGGGSWSLLTDPFTPGTSGIPHLPRPLFAHFDHDTTGTIHVYLGTGRGVWRVDLALADLAVTKGAAPDPVITGSDITYTIDVSNNGPNASDSIALTDALPPSVGFETLSSPPGWSCTTPAVSASGTVTCTRSDMAAGSTGTFTLVGKVACSVVDQTAIANSATIAATLPDPLPDNNSASVTTHASNPPPVITCPQDITVECTGNCGIQASDPQLMPFFTGVSTTDNCPGVVITNDGPAFFDLGTKTVVFTATDSAGATANCSARVNVVDTRPPVISVALSRDTLWPPNHNLVDIVATVGVTDVCDPHPTFVLASITSSEPDDGLGDGDTVKDIQGAAPGTPDTAFRLRSERSGSGSGRIYTILYTASDKSGNTAQAKVTVTVPHDLSGSAKSGAGFNSNGTAFLSAAQTFELLVVSTNSIDATTIDSKVARVGNTSGVIDALQNRIADVNGDGKPDVVVTYSAAAARRVQSVSGPKTPLAFRYVTRDGTAWIVSDISKLGSPLVSGR